LGKSKEPGLKQPSMKVKEKVEFALFKKTVTAVLKKKKTTNESQRKVLSKVILF